MAKKWVLQDREGFKHRSWVQYPGEKVRPESRRSWGGDATKGYIDQLREFEYRCDCGAWRWCKCVVLEEGYMAVDGGGCDEELSLFLYKGNVKKEIIKALQGKEMGLRDHGELIKLHVVPYDKLWRITADAKALSAVALYEMAKRDGLLSFVYSVLWSLFLVVVRLKQSWPELRGVEAEAAKALIESERSDLTVIYVSCVDGITTDDFCCNRLGDLSLNEMKGTCFMDHSVADPNSLAA
ncbi:hypothetical protein IEQ34_015052 [Dendrobium chrysotoxum]|uniref:Uncharacterized protein n=1 Tax=Dendrobium chrysotoxum TaxID=161865 RepID=A0AAV7GNF4_DENCH|nr:hypothetical protein IEQ34_015052 [Dendrobium chrysotoxum]